MENEELTEIPTNEELIGIIKQLVEINQNLTTQLIERSKPPEEEDPLVTLALQQHNLVKYLGRLQSMGEAFSKDIRGKGGQKCK